MANGSERRKYFRVNLDNPFYPQMAIEQLTTKALQGNAPYTYILEDISPGGLRFISNVQFQVNPIDLVELEIRILDETVHVKGYIVWCGQEGADVYRYGVEFEMEETIFIQLVTLLNRVKFQGIMEAVHNLKKDYQTSLNRIRSLSNITTTFSGAEEETAAALEGSIANFGMELEDTLNSLNEITEEFIETIRQLK